MIVIDRHAARVLELAWLVAILAELGHERAIITREHLHSMMLGICHHQEATLMIERHTMWLHQHAIVVAHGLHEQTSERREQQVRFCRGKDEMRMRESERASAIPFKLPC